VTEPAIPERLLNLTLGELLRELSTRAEWIDLGQSTVELTPRELRTFVNQQPVRLAVEAWQAGRGESG
jgi:hypothetical protein